MLNEVSMRHGRLLPNLPRWSRALLLFVVPVACATGTQPSLDDLPIVEGMAGTTVEEGGSSSAGTDAGGTPGSAGTLPLAGTTGTTAGSSSGGKGGSTGQGGKSGSSSGGAATAGSAGKGGTGTGGSAGGSAGRGGTGTGGSSGGASGGSGGSGGAGDACGCLTAPKPWVDNSVMSFKTGDCLTTGGKTYRYTGTKAQTYANGSCNPAKQETW